MKLLSGNIFIRTTQVLSVLLIIASMGFVSFSHHCIMAERVKVTPCCERTSHPANGHSVIKDNSACCYTAITGGITLNEIVIEKSYKFEKLKTTANFRLAMPDDIPDHRDRAFKLAYSHQIHPKTPLKIHKLNEAYLN
jgi:hypothetical protein